ncbi:MAG: hypothetical protein N2316_14165, partial [Spirochaetes bacterium]|nr:hypothetical protein [Spirochaetota bacterium]
MARYSIHTTVNLLSVQANVLDDYARRLQMKRSELVVRLLHKVIANCEKMQRSFASVKYQKGKAGDKWKRVHVVFEHIDYEVFTDMRNCFKWSVSALLAKAISMYLEEIIVDGGRSSLNDKYDNYLVVGYNCLLKFDKNKICWHITWELA